MRYLDTKNCYDFAKGAVETVQRLLTGIEYKSGVMAPKATGALYAWVLCRVCENMTNAKNVFYSQDQGNGALHATGDFHLYKSQKMTSDLPVEIVTEILSWLPVKSLMSFKCVCKQWCFFMDQGSKFKAKHYDHASPLEFSYIYVWETNSKAANTIFDENFICYSNFGGLFLEKNRTRSQVFRVRNPAMHLALTLPDTHEGIREIDFALNLFTGECKVACFYMKNATYFGTEVGFEVITIGKDDR